MTDDTDDTITLPEIADFLNRELSLDPPIKRTTPLIWWDRTSRRGMIDYPMPEPVRRTGKRRSPHWHPATILAWYRDWKAI